VRARTTAVAIFAPLLALVAVDAYSATVVYRSSQARAALKRDEASVHGIEHGLLSVDAWMAHLRRMVIHEVDHFHLTPVEREEARAQLASTMNELVGELRRRQPDSLRGKIGKAALDVIVPKSEAPALADTLIDEAGKPETRARVKKLALQKLAEYAAESRDADSDEPTRREIFARKQVAGLHDFDRLVADETHALERRAWVYTGVIVASMLVMLLAWLFVHRRATLARLQRPLFALALVMAATALAAGLASPMIEVDARIRRIDFVLLGQHLRFDDQVLFYQAKSILQVVWTLFETHQADSMFVAALILAFSIVLPTAKLICTELVLLGSPRMKESRFLKIVAFKTGKWSMADVLVVAIFMAYVGFKAILDSQLAGMNLHTASLSSITTDKTSLQPAFILFASFVLFGLVLAELIKRAAAKDAPDEKEA
jgi:hypothetical protein